MPLDADEHLLQIPECQRMLISLTGKGFERALLGKLDWLTYMYDIPLLVRPLRTDVMATEKCLSGLRQGTVRTRCA